MTKLVKYMAMEKKLVKQLKMNTTKELKILTKLIKLLH